MEILSQSDIQTLKRSFTHEFIDSYIAVATKPHKKKKSILVLCVSSSVKPVSILIYIVKQLDKSDFKKKLLANINQIKGIDCYDSLNQPSFDIEFKFCDGHSKRLFASQIQEKHRFIERLIRLISIHDINHFNSIIFHNLPNGKSVEDFLRDRRNEILSQNDASLIQSPTGLDATDFNRYQNLSKQEEENLQKFLLEKPTAMINAAEFQESLKNHMLAMESINVQSIMSSQQQLSELMEEMDQAIDQVEILEKKMEIHDQFLSEVEASMSCLRDRDEMLKLNVKNRENLQSSLYELLRRLSLNDQAINSLIRLDLSSPKSISQALKAADQLAWLLNNPPDEDLRKLSAAREKQNELQNVADEFSRQFATQFNNALTRQHHKLIATTTNLSVGALDKVIEYHKAARLELEPFVDVMVWLKTNRVDTFTNLQRIYLEKMADLYNKEITSILNVLIERLSSNRTNFSFYPSSNTNQASSSLLKLSSHKSQSNHHDSRPSETGTSLPNDPVKTAMAQKFESVFEDFIDKLKPLVLEEENFMTRLFRLDIRRQSERPAELNAQNQSDQSQPKYKELLLDASNVVFNHLSNQLQMIINNLEAQDPSQSLLMLVVVNRQYDTSVKSSGFLVILWGVLFLHTKRSFNKYIDTFIKNFREVKAPKKSRVGILPFVSAYAIFAEQTYRAFHDSSRQNDLTTAHLKIVRELMNQVERIANDSVKAPRDVIVLENYHRMKDILRRLKMPDLDELFNEIKTKYLDALESYVGTCVGRPFEKLYIFFENVERAIEKGIRPEEISYQFAFNRTELRKVVKEYPGKEVKKGLEALCKKVERFLSDEEGLFNVVWVHVQSQFLEAVGRYRDLIDRCYSNSRVDFDFTDEELTRYFQEISQGRM